MIETNRTDQSNPLPSYLSYLSASHSALSASPLIKSLENQKLDMEQRRSQSMAQNKSFRFAMDIVWHIHRRQNECARLEIAAKGAREPGFWVRLIRETESHDQQELADLLKECGERLRMLTSIILPLRRKCAAADLRLHCKTQISRSPKPLTQNQALPSI
jgi:hypothetical protein